MENKLPEPALSSVQVEPEPKNHLAELREAIDRVRREFDLPRKTQDTLVGKRPAVLVPAVFKDGELAINPQQQSGSNSIECTEVNIIISAPDTDEFEIYDIEPVNSESIPDDEAFHLYDTLGRVCATQEVSTTTV